MATNDNEVVTDLYPTFRLYKNGRVERFYEYFNVFYVPQSQEDPVTGVSSKDITISSHVSARLYLPKNTSNEKLPVLVFYHGGGLVLGSAFFNKVHRFFNHLVSESNAIGVSVEYRLAPENDLAILYEDCWTALQWVASHSENNNSTNTNKDSWLTSYGDFNKVFIAGESAGGNIVYHMAMRAGTESLNGNVKILGSILACPFFLMPDENIDYQGNLAYNMWVTICPELESGLSPIDSPMINPLAEKAPRLLGLGCSRLFMGIAENDVLVPREIMVRFVEGVKRSGWNGELVFFEVEGEEHCFFIEDPEAEKAKDLIKRFASFIQHK
ncbi:hydrolase 3-like [Lycium ferocissimum]|uniref:hydrolase 3-like n=1 Tax=Lycium ferocissimum TaxID=112874 RepID=UPI00281515DA|nr:hydrolase 3-like [Lycium ferocissimum]